MRFVVYHLLPELVLKPDWSRLRRAVLHPHLVLSAEDTAEAASTSNKDEKVIDVDAIEEDTSAQNNYAGEVLKNLVESDDDECPLCLDIMETPMIIPPCMHKW